MSYSYYDKLLMNLMRFSKGGMTFDGLASHPIPDILDLCKIAEEMNKEMERQIKAKSHH